MYSSSVDNNPCTWRYNYNDECVKGYQVANSKCYVNYSDNAVSMMGQYQENSINNLSWSTPFDCVNNHNHHLNDSITTNQAYNNISALPPPSNEHVINLYDLCPDRLEPMEYNYAEQAFREMNSSVYYNTGEESYYYCNQINQAPLTYTDTDAYRTWETESSHTLAPSYLTSNGSFGRPIVPGSMEDSFCSQNQYWNKLPIPIMSRYEVDRCTHCKTAKADHANMFSCPNSNHCFKEYKNFNANSSHSMSVNLEMNMSIPHSKILKKPPVSSIQMQTCSTKYKVMAQVSEHITIKQHNITDVYRVQRNSNYNKSKTLCSQLKHIEINQFDSIGQHDYNSMNSEPCHSNVFNIKSSTKSNLCVICGKNYARPSTLKTHLRTHSGEKPYRCNICEKAFSQAANLTAHIRTHSGEKPFPCPICQRRFSQSSSVTTHLRTHSGERPYCCDYCHKAFSDSSTLTKHLRIHSGEKPYQCRMCLLRFSQSGNLNRHMRIHTHN